METLILEEKDNSLKFEKNNMNKNNKLPINTIMPKFKYVNKKGQNVTVSKNIPL